MNTVQHYVNRIEAKIAHYRHRASKLVWLGRLTQGPFLVIFFGIGSLALITGFLNSSYRNPFFGRPIYHILLWYTQNFPSAWMFLTWLSPAAPTTAPQSLNNFGFVAWMISWGFGLMGLKWLGARAVQEAKKLRDQADKDQNQLEFQEPGWRQVEMVKQQMEKLQNYQTVAVGSITSSAVTIAPNITQHQNQMYTVLTRGEEKKGWWTKPVGLIGIGVIIHLVSSILSIR